MGCTRSPPGCEEKKCDLILNAKRDKGHLRVTLLKRDINGATETLSGSRKYDRRERTTIAQDRRTTINDRDSLSSPSTSSGEVLILELTPSDRQEKIQFRCHVGENRVNN